MRVFAVPSGRPSSAATCSWVRSSRKARLSASRCGGGSSSSADLRTARRCCSHVASAVAGGQVGEHEPLRIGHDVRLAVSVAQLVQEAVVCDLQDPRADGAPLGIEPSSIAPDGQEDVLDEVLGSRPIE